MPQASVFCRVCVVGFHKWPGAPAEYSYLRDLHRHEFHVRVDVKVHHPDRCIEFNDLKRMVTEELTALADTYSLVSGGPSILDYGARSVEQIAIDLDLRLQKKYKIFVSVIEVSEDGENGARVTFA